MIEPKRKTLGDLYKSNAILSVPTYQRSYDWGKGEVYEMVADLRSAMESNAPLFLGSFVLDTSNITNIQIVDGQQRITSFTLLLIACRQRAKELQNFAVAQQIQNKISFTDETTGKMISERIRVSPSISDVFNYIADENWNGVFPTKIGAKQVRRQSNKLQSLYDYMYKEVAKLTSDELSQFLKTVYNSYIIEIDITDTLEAFDIFERTNARGLPLNVTDLLKNYLFSNSETANQEMKQSWDEITSNSEGTLQRMLKYFWVSHNGAVRKKDLYRELKKYGNDEGVEKLTAELYDFSVYYAALKSNENERVKAWLTHSSSETMLATNNSYLNAFCFSLKALNNFQITQHYPLIYAITKNFLSSSQSERDVKILLRTIGNIEKYHFINNQICDRVGNEIEIPYADFSRRFASESDFVLLCDDLNALLKDKLAKEEEFRTRFVELDYQSTSLSDLCYIFDRFNNNDLKVTEWVPLFNPDKSILRNDFNTEHFYPQNPDSEEQKTDVELIDNIGNLFVIPRHTNSSIGNKSPKEKAKLLKDKGRRLRYVTAFVEEFEKSDGTWSNEQIKTRAETMAKEAYRKIWQLK